MSQFTESNYALRLIMNLNRPLLRNAPFAPSINKKLIIVKRGDRWSQKELYEGGYLAGREKVFGVWIEGPHTSTYLNSNGVAIWLCKYIIYYPNGNRQEFGPYGFYTPGFNIMSVNPSGNNGKWKIEYYIWNRDTQDSFLIDTKEFYITD